MSDQHGSRPLPPPGYTPPPPPGPPSTGGFGSPPPPPPPGGAVAPTAPLPAYPPGPPGGPNPPPGYGPPPAPPGYGPTPPPGPPPGGFAPTPPPGPPSGPGGATPAQGGKKKSKLPLVLGAVGLIAVIAIVASLVVIVRGNQQDEERRRAREEQAAAAAEAREAEAEALEADQEALALAIGEGDTEAVTALLEERPDLVEATDPVDLDEPVEVTLGAGGYGTAVVTLAVDDEYMVAVDGPNDPGVVLVDPAEEADAVAGALVVATSGDHTLLVGGGDEGDVVTVTFSAVRTEAYEFEPVTYEIAAPGEVIDLTLETLGGELYDVIFSGSGVRGTIFDADDEIVLELDPADEATIRYSVSDDTTYRLRIEGETPTATGSVEVDIVALAHWTAFAGEESDEWYLESETEPELVQPRLDSSRNVLTFCLYLRPDLDFQLAFTPTTPGATWTLQIFTDEDARTAGTVATEFTNIETAGIDIATADSDRRPCYDLVPTSDVSSAVDVRVTEVA